MEKLHLKIEKTSSADYLQHWRGKKRSYDINGKLMLWLAYSKDVCEEWFNIEKNMCKMWNFLSTKKMF